MMKTILGLAAAAALALTLPAIAQPAGDAKKIEIPKNTFYLGLGPTQYLAKTRLIGQPLLDKSGNRLATIDDVILGTNDNKIDGIIIDYNGKKYGVMWQAVKVESKDGKTTVTAAGITEAMLKSSMPAYGARAPSK